MTMLAAVITCAGWVILAQSLVGLRQASFNSARGDGYDTLPGSYYRGENVLFTNCILFVGATTNGAVQTLTNVTITLTVGNANGTNNVVTATTDDTASGTWFATVPVPTNSGDVDIEVKLTDANTNTFVYPHKRMILRDKL